MTSVDAFKKLLNELEPHDLVENYLLSQGALHVSDLNIGKIKNAIARKYNISNDSLEIWVVGSAKLGFSISEKRRANEFLPRYRPFSAFSDVDIAVVSPKIFERIWLELSTYAHFNTRIMPWNSDKLGDYLVHGWLRIDKAPRRARLPLCDDWGDCFRSLSANSSLGRRSIRGGLYYSKEFLIQYHCRSIIECMQEEIKK